jgi:hypothetical protein
MLALGFAAFDVAHPTTWVALGAGAVVASLVLVAPIFYRRWRRWPLSDASREEDLPWQDLLNVLEQLNRARAVAGLPPEQPTKEEVGRLLARLPAVPGARPLELPEDREFQLVGGDERRAGQRRWGNPIVVHVLSPLRADPLHGVVVNRSTGGLGIFVDEGAPPGTSLHVRAAEAPADLAWARVEVRHCLPVGGGAILGCEFSEDVPWNVRVWFG